MKKVLLLLIAAGIAVTSFSQESIAPSWKKRPTLGINFFLKDFISPDIIGHEGLGLFLRGKYPAINTMSPGFGIQYLQGLSEYIDFSANLNSSFLKYTFYDGSKAQNDQFLLETSAALNFKLLPDNYVVDPYVTVGVGASMLAGTYFGAYAPVGAGFQFALGDGAFLNLQWLYNLRVSDNTNYNFQYSLGFASPLTEKKQPKLAPLPVPPPPVVEKDTDGDGIVDSKDKCPTVPGVAKYDGCPVPDTDGDGINDENDKCPTVKGLARYNGCPIPDTDGDGINDEEDSCKTVPGVARYHGCPIPDRDGDGVNDEEDKCPEYPGPASNHGCPELKEIHAENILFARDKAILTKKATDELDRGATLLNTKYPHTSILIDGYTSNTGTAQHNLVLSQKRADAVKAYLVKKGVSADRLTATGYGIANPVADNKTQAGRDQNRRVEFKVKQ